MVREPESICWPSISRNKAHLATLGATCHLKSAQELPSVALLGVGAVRSSSPDGGPVGYQTLQSSETGVKINIWNLSLYSRDLLCVLSEFSCVMSDSLRPHGLQPTRVLSPLDGVLQARILEWVTMLSSRKSSWLRDRTPKSRTSPALAGGSLPLAPPGKPTQRTQWFLFLDKQSWTTFAHLKL